MADAMMVPGAVLDDGLLPFKSEVHALLHAGLARTRDALTDMKRMLDGGRLLPQERELVFKSAEWMRRDIARFEAVIPKALEWRDATDEPTDEDVDHAVAAMRHEFGSHDMVSEENAIRVALTADRKRRATLSVHGRNHLNNQQEA